MFTNRSRANLVQMGYEMFLCSQTLILTIFDNVKKEARLLVGRTTKQDRYNRIYCHGIWIFVCLKVVTVCRRHSNARL